MRKPSLLYFSSGIRLLATSWSEKYGSWRRIGGLLCSRRGGAASPSPDAAAEVWSINASRQRWRDHIILRTSLHLNSEKGKATGLIHGKIIFSLFDLIHFFLMFPLNWSGVSNGPHGLHALNLIQTTATYRGLRSFIGGLSGVGFSCPERWCYLEAQRSCSCPGLSLRSAPSRLSAKK